jgi:large subunit ribosomal protein L15
MFNLSNLTDTTRPKRKYRRIGRGVGSKRGKTAGRGSKGDGSRQGYRRRFGYEGGQVPLYRKLPVRGFTRGRFVKETVALSLSLIDKKYGDGESVNLITLREKGLIPRRLTGGVKIIKGEIKKKVSIEAHKFSEAAAKYLEEKKISFKTI